MRKGFAFAASTRKYRSRARARVEVVARLACARVALASLVRVSFARVDQPSALSLAAVCVRFDRVRRPSGRWAHRTRAGRRVGELELRAPESRRKTERLGETERHTARAQRRASAAIELHSASAAVAAPPASAPLVASR